MRADMLEVHYDNQDYLAERVDNSGIRLYVTEQLQKEQAAMLTFGRVFIAFVREKASWIGQKAR